MGRTTSTLGTPGFGLSNSYQANDGRQIDWDNVNDTDADGRKIVKAGTIMAENADAGGKLAPRKAGLQDATPADYPATCLLRTNAVQGDEEAAISGYGVILGGVIYKNMLPDSGDADFDAWLTELKSNGTGFVFDTYSDSRTS